MFRLLGLIAFATLLILIVCGPGPHNAHSHVARVDRIERPSAVSTATALESVPDLAAMIASMDPVPQGVRSEHFPAIQIESISLQDPLTASSVLRV